MKTKRINEKGKERGKVIVASWPLLKKRKEVVTKQVVGLNPLLWPKVSGVEPTCTQPKQYVVGVG